MANMYLNGMAKIADGTIQWGTSDIRCALVTSTYTYSEAHTALSQITNECTNANYVRKALACVVTPDAANHRNLLDATDVTWTALGSGTQPYAAVIYKYVAGGDANCILIGYVTLTTPPAPNGGDYTVVWNALGLITDTDT